MTKIDRVMAHLIDKTALVAEIDRQKIGYNVDGKHSVEYNTVRKVLDIIDTLEVKEVDFSIEIYKYIDEHFNVYYDGNQTLQTKDKKSLIGRDDVEAIAKHFFELGMQVSNKAQKGGQNMKTGIELIAEERQRQIDVEGYSKQHDSQHNASEFVYAAISYAESAKVGINCMEIGNTNENEIMVRKVEMGKNYPFGWDFKPSTDIRDLVKAGALIAATIDRLQAQKGE